LKECVITQSAVDVINKESRSVYKMGRETGGILIGPRPTDTAIVITSATGPGPDGDLASYAGWETDPDYLNEKLIEARDENPVVNLRGFWHRHPGRIRRPSSQDLMEARRILEDVEHYKLHGELVMPIVTVTQKRIAIRAYYITNNEQGFEEIPVKVVPDSDEMVKALLSPRKVIEFEEGTAFWRDSDWQFYKTPYGAERLESELNDLSQAEHEAEARLLDDGNCCIEVCMNKGSQKILFLLPREYPLNPPQVFMKLGEDIRELYMDGSSLLCRWSSACRLVDLADDVRVTQSRGINRKGKTRYEVLMCARDDFRNGNFDRSRWSQHLFGIIRGCL